MNISARVEGGVGGSGLPSRFDYGGLIACRFSSSSHRGGPVRQLSPDRAALYTLGTISHQSPNSWPLKPLITILVQAEPRLARPAP
jgi:hypothetical protein